MEKRVLLFKFLVLKTQYDSVVAYCNWVYFCRNKLRLTRSEKLYDAEHEYEEVVSDVMTFFFLHFDLPLYVW